MSVHEWMALIGLLGTPLGVGVKLLYQLVQDTKAMKQALLGDEYGHPGLVADVAAVKQEVDDVKRSQARTEFRVDEIESRLEAIEGRDAA